MATFEQLGELVTTQLRDRVERLASVVEDDAADLAEVADLAQAVGEMAGTIEEIYRDLDQMLVRGLQGRDAAEQEDDDDSHRAGGETIGEHRQAQSGHNGSRAEDVTKEDLLERARDANIHGRSSMSKDELAQAVEAEEDLTKEELLERAREAEIEGRSSMTKEELRQALRDAGV
jgi:hypothetical protein